MSSQSILSVLFAMALLAACGKKDEQNNANSEANNATENKEKTEAAPANKFVGKWEIVEAEGDMASLNKGVVYTFTNDEMSTSMAKGKYSISGDTLLVNFEGLQQPFKYLFKWEGEKLKLDVLNSGGQKFLLEKR